MGKLYQIVGHFIKLSLYKIIIKLCRIIILTSKSLSSLDMYFSVSAPVLHNLSRWSLNNWSSKIENSVYDNMMHYYLREMNILEHVIMQLVSYRQKLEHEQILNYYWVANPLNVLRSDWMTTFTCTRQIGRIGGFSGLWHFRDSVFVYTFAW